MAASGAADNILKACEALQDQAKCLGEQFADLLKQKEGDSCGPSCPPPSGSPCCPSPCCPCPSPCCLCPPQCCSPCPSPCAPPCCPSPCCPSPCPRPCPAPCCAPCPPSCPQICFPCSPCGPCSPRGPCYPCGPTGPCCMKVTQVNCYGKFIKLVNTSCYKLQCGCPIASYRFHPCACIPPQCTSKVWSACFDPGLLKLPNDFVSCCTCRWCCGCDVTTVLCRPEGTAVSWLVGCYEPCPPMCTSPCCAC